MKENASTDMIEVDLCNNTERCQGTLSEKKVENLYESKFIYGYLYM